MDTPFPFELLLAFAVMGSFLWLGSFLRAKVPLFRNYMVPSSLIGGVIGLVFFNLGLIPVGHEMFQTIAYHFFVISFISIGLTTAEKIKDKSAARQIFRGAGWLGLVNIFSMASQTLLGMLICAFLVTLGLNLHPNFGYMLGLGFTQGPGQILTFARLWELEAGFTNAVDVGLALKVMGFFFAFLGVPVANWGIRKGYAAAVGGGEIPEHVLRGMHREGEEMEAAGYMPMYTSNIDSLAFQFSAVGVAYGITYFYYYLLSLVFANMAVLWGFFFGGALLSAILMKFVMSKLKVFYLIDQGLQRRISGWSVDFLMVATIIPISLPVVWEFITPIMVMSVAAGLWTFAFCFYLGRRISPLGLERMLIIYGSNCGTIINSLLLLRIVDPQFRTTAPMECGSFVLFSFPGVMAVLILLTSGASLGLGFWHISGILAGMCVLCIVLLKAFGLIEKGTKSY